MTQHLTSGQVIVRRKLAALARVALDLCDALAAAGHETTDVPRMWWLTMDRWGRADGDPKRLGVDLATTGAAVSRWYISRVPLAVPVHRTDAVENLCRTWGTAMRYWPRNPGHTQHEAAILRTLVRAWIALGEPLDAAARRVAELHHRHGLDVEREHQEATLRAAASSRAADRVRAEAILALPEVPRG